MHQRRHDLSVQIYLRLLVVVAILLVGASMAPRLAAAAAPAQLDLEFDGSDNAASLSAFLATTLPGTNAPNGGATVHTAAPGTLQIVTSAGDLAPFGAGQDNALAYQYDSAGSYTIGARLLKPVFSTPYQSAGIYIGK
ncbi:MAG TPA: hypothetical protein VKE41_12880, partial [Roseiflexaceae bacterium]|nr:hypothetical protein [Roseiflexaceae bacterium]